MCFLLFNIQPLLLAPFHCGCTLLLHKQGCTLNLPSVRWLGLSQAGLFPPAPAAGDTQQYRNELFMSVSKHAPAVQNAGCRADQICGYVCTPIMYTEQPKQRIYGTYSIFIQSSIQVRYIPERYLCICHFNSSRAISGFTVKWDYLLVGALPVFVEFLGKWRLGTNQVCGSMRGKMQMNIFLIVLST